jgi:phosphoribosylanthranilate isomerase
MSGNELKRHLPIEGAPALGSEAMPRTERVESAQNKSINAQKSDFEAGSSDEPGMVDWLLVDKVLAGSGEAPDDWTNLQVPQSLSRRGSLLAGGLDPMNVAAALGAAAPDGVDVSSRVMGLNRIKMDKTKVEAFIQTVKSSAAFCPDVDSRALIEAFDELVARLCMQLMQQFKLRY